MRVGATKAVGIAVLATGLSVAALAQQAPPTPQKPPALRSRVTVVPISLTSASSTAGAAGDRFQTRGLHGSRGRRSATDRRVFDAGLRRRRDGQGLRVSPRGHAEADAAPRNRRVFLFVLGRGRHQTASKYIDALMSFLYWQALPQDQVALQAWNRATDFTTDHALLQMDRPPVSRLELPSRPTCWMGSAASAPFYGSRDRRTFRNRLMQCSKEAASLRARPLPPAPIADQQRIDREARDVTDNLLRNRQIQDKLAAGMSSLPDSSPPPMRPA